MRRFYSFMLMAAALLIGANAWAGLVNVTYNSVPGKADDSFTSLQAAVDYVNAGDSATLTLEGDQYLTAVVRITGQKLCLDLAGNTVKEDNGSISAGVGCFELLKGTLHVKNGTISHNVKGSGTNVTRSAITVLGAPWANKTTVWSVLIIDEDVVINTNENAKQYGITVDASSAEPNLNSLMGYTTWIQNQSTAPTDKGYVKNKSNKYDSGCAFGVRILVKGNVSGYQRGINVGGNINANPTQDGASSLFPYIKVYPGAELSCQPNDLESGNGGIYAAGYAVLDISGYVHGQTGILVKSGEITLDNAIVASDSEQSKASGNYGGDVAGTGIFIASDASYAGDVKVAIEGGTTVTSGTATNAAAIVDVYASNTTETQVSHIAITGGTIEGDIELTTATGGKTEVTGGTLPETVTIGTTATEVTSLMPSGYHATTVIDDSDPLNPKEIVIVSPGTSAADITVSLNGSGLASFSATDTYVVPENFVAYSSNGQFDPSTDYLELTVHEAGDNIPAGEGVFLYYNKPGSKPTEVTLQPYTAGGDVIAYEGNFIKPATAWNANLKGLIYILHGTELWEYTGSTFPANKAFLQIPESIVDPNAAPKRISLRFAEPQGVESLEAGAKVKAIKFIENGNILIKRGEKVYNVQGQIVK